MIAHRNLALEQLNQLPHAPSVGLQDVPSESIGTHLKMPEYDELDQELAREWRSLAVKTMVNLNNKFRPNTASISTAGRRSDNNRFV